MVGTRPTERVTSHDSRLVTTRVHHLWIPVNNDDLTDRHDDRLPGHRNSDNGHRSISVRTADRIYSPVLFLTSLNPQRPMDGADGLPDSKTRRYDRQLR